MRFLVLLTLFSTSLVAQNTRGEAPTLGRVELGGFGGLSGGLGRIGAGFGFSGGVAPIKTAKWFMPYGEFTYFPSITTGSQAAVLEVCSGSSCTKSAITDKVGFTEFHGGVHIRQLIAGKSLAWYPAIGFGVVRPGSFNYRDPDLQKNYTLGPYSDFAVNGGAGLRWYVTDGFGMRFEAKVYKPTTGNYPDPFFKVTVGLFWFAKYRD